MCAACLIIPTNPYGSLTLHCMLAIQMMHHIHLLIFKCFLNLMALMVILSPKLMAMDFLVASQSILKEKRGTNSRIFVLNSQIRFNCYNSESATALKSNMEKWFVQDFLSVCMLLLLSAAVVVFKCLDVYGGWWVGVWCIDGWRDGGMEGWRDEIHKRQS